MDLRFYREAIPWLGLLLLVVGLLQAMAVVPLFESFIGVSRDFLHENIMGIMLVAVAFGTIVWQPLSGPIIGGVTALLVAIANALFATTIGSLGWLVMGVIEAACGIAQLYVFWHSRVAVCQAAGRITGRRLQAAALASAVVAAMLAAYAYAAQRIDPRLWYGIATLAMVAIGMGTAIIGQRRGALLTGVIAVVAGTLVLLPFYISLLP